MGYNPAQISIAIHKLRTEADNPNRGLYGNNKAVYSLLGYGVQVKNVPASRTRLWLLSGSEPRGRRVARA